MPRLTLLALPTLAPIRADSALTLHLHRRMTFALVAASNIDAVDLDTFRFSYDFDDYIESQVYLAIRAVYTDAVQFFLRLSFSIYVYESCLQDGRIRRCSLVNALKHYHKLITSLMQWTYCIHDTRFCAWKSELFRCAARCCWHTHDMQHRLVQAQASVLYLRRQFPDPVV